MPGKVIRPTTTATGPAVNRSPALDQLGEELAISVRHYRKMAHEAAESEARYKHARALKIVELRKVDGLAVSMCEYQADADPEMWELHRQRLNAAAEASALKIHCEELRERLGAERTQTVEERGV